MAALGLYDRWLDERETQFAVVDAALTTREGRKPLPDLAKLSDLREYYTNNRTIQRTPDRDEAIHHWNEFHEIMVSEQKNLTSIKRGFPWQIWLQNGDHNFGTGINGNISTTLSGDFSGTVHKYDGIPNNSVIQLSHYTQSGKRFYLGTAKIELLDAIGSVPAIPKETKAEISAQRALDPRMYPNQWQRKMDKDRVLQIREWSDSDSKQMLINSIILYLPPHAFKNGVTLTQTGKLTIDFSKFLSRQGRNSEIYSDWKLVRDRLTREQVLTDRRPIWILDGQHRTRGMGISKKGSKLSVPITVLSSSGPGSVTTAEAAKIFTEINTNAESLHQRLELFLANRYRTTGKEATDFADPNEHGISQQSSQHRRANREAYHLAAWLCGASSEGDPLYGSIAILHDNSSKITSFTIEMWMKVVKKWFMPGSIYCPNSPENLSQDEIFNEVGDYFHAWMNTCNHDEWANNPSLKRWDSLRGTSQSMWEQDTQFRILLYIFERIIPLLESRGKERPISLQTFEEALKPMKFVDPLDDTLLSRLARGSEVYWKQFAPWCMRAIEGGECPPESEVMSNDINNAHTPPRSVLARPYKVEPTNTPRWPTPNRASEIFLPRPTNSWRPVKRLSTTVSAVTNDGIKLATESKLITSNDELGTGDEIRITIMHDRGMSNSLSIDVKVELNGPFGPTENTYEIKKQS